MEKSGNPSDHFVSKHDRNSLLEVRGRYLNLRDTIQQLSHKLTSVSTHIEEEFLSAYRVHMLSVQQELRELKQQVVKVEDALNEDKQVAQLEHEVTWFSDETTRLKNQSTSMKKDMQHVIMHTQALREQRLFLGEQLKSTLKRSRILEAEIADLLSREQGQDLDEAVSRAGSQISSPSRTKLQGSASGGLILSKSSSYQRPKLLPGGKSKSMSKFPPLRKSPQKQNMPSSASTDAFTDILLPRKAKTEGPSSLHVDELVQLKMSRPAAELELEAAIKSVLREIIERKVNAAARDKRIPVEEVKELPKFFDMGGLSGLGLDHFSDSDRLSAVSIFLTRPTSFKLVVMYLSEELKRR